VESPCRQFWISSCKSAMRNLSPWENRWRRSVHISDANSIHIIVCLMAGVMERVSHEITILLQRFQASCKGSLKGGHGRVPIQNNPCFWFPTQWAYHVAIADSCYRKEEATPRQEQDSHRGEETGDGRD